MPACLWERIQQQQRVFPPHLSVCMPPVSLALHLSVSHGRKRKESMSPSFSLCLAKQFSICSEQVVNPKTTKGTKCKNAKWGCRNTEC